MKGIMSEDEDLIPHCVEIFRKEQTASIALLQRRLHLGYWRASRLMEEIERRGIVGPAKGNGEPRDLFLPETLEPNSNAKIGNDKDGEA